MKIILLFFLMIIYMISLNSRLFNIISILLTLIICFILCYYNRKIELVLILLVVYIISLVLYKKKQNLEGFHGSNNLDIFNRLLNIGLNLTSKNRTTTTSPR